MEAMAEAAEDGEEEYEEGEELVEDEMDRSHLVSKLYLPYHTIPYHTLPYHTIPYPTNPYHTTPSYPSTPRKTCHLV